VANVYRQQVRVWLWKWSRNYYNLVNQTMNQIAAKGCDCMRAAGAGVGAGTIIVAQV
jgi:hypothetical protein